MVQYVFTPWRDRHELLRVRRQFYPRPPALQQQSTSSYATPPQPSVPEDDDKENAERHRAIARVLMWTHRGGCPHMVESTALLMAAILQDGATGRRARGRSAAAEDYAVLAAYLTAFTRFVTGLLDGHQEKQRKLSMYGVAKTIGLPTAFVELRHQATHEPLPSLAQLRSAARRALAWIWNYYWKNLPDEEGRDASPPGGGGRSREETDGEAGQEAERVCREALTGYLQDGGGDEEARKKEFMADLKMWDEGLVLRLLAEVGDATRDNKVLLRSIRLSRDILAAKDARERGEAASGDMPPREQEPAEEGTSMAEDTVMEPAEEEGPAWSRYEGPWTPKPIGIV